MVYYNENDAYAAAWLRKLIEAGHIAKGDVDERSIVDVRAEDVRGYAQAHFFAGIGGWSHSLRLAGWPDDRPVWAGSVPCQPFSAAGKGEGYADERHLWPHWLGLIRECRPPAIFGEQVDAAIRGGWLDDVCLSLEDLGYAVGAVDFPACSVGAPHIRQRLYWVADAGSKRRQQERRGASGDEEAHGRARRNRSEPDGDHIATGHGATGRLADTTGEGAARGFGSEGSARGACGPESSGSGATDGLGNADDARLQGRRLLGATGDGDGADQRAAWEAGATNGFWRGAEWIACRDGKARPVEPALERIPDGLSAGLGLVRLGRYSEGKDEGEGALVFAPLVAGGKNRDGRLRGYGNAIVAPQAAEFVRAYMDIS